MFNKIHSHVYISTLTFLLTHHTECKSVYTVTNTGNINQYNMSFFSLGAIIMHEQSQLFCARTNTDTQKHSCRIAGLMAEFVIKSCPVPLFYLQRVMLSSALSLSRGTQVRNNNITMWNWLKWWMQKPILKRCWRGLERSSWRGASPQQQQNPL